MIYANKATKELRREFGLNDYNYEGFKEWYYKSHNSKIYNSLSELWEFFKEGKEEDVIQVAEHVKEWNKYRSTKLKEAEASEEYLIAEFNKYLSVLNEHGYIYEARNLSIGDSPSFYDEKDNEYHVSTNTYSIDITSCLEGESILDVKKKTTRDVLFESVSTFINKEIDKSNVKGNLYLFKSSVKIVYDDMLIKEDNNHFNLIIKLGIKLL